MTQEEAEAFVWGLWEFNTNASVQIATNRMSQTRAYSRVTGKNWDLLPLIRTRPGHWMSTYSQQQWQGDYEDHPVRLLITCRREGYEPWTLLYEVATGAGLQEKKQAGEIKVQPRTFDGGQAGVLTGGQSKPVHILVVTNVSPRPIRNLAAEVNVLGSVSPGRKPADVVGKIEPAAQRGPAIPETFAPAAHSGRKDLLNAGEEAAFAWSLDVETFPLVEFTVRFADDQDLNWEVGPDLRLKKLPARDW